MSTILTTIRWLSIFTGALSLFYLGHAWFEFGLGEVFARVYTWYARILHPVVQMVEPLALWLVGWLQLKLPFWWRDAASLYFCVGGAMGRVWGLSYFPRHHADWYKNDFKPSPGLRSAHERQVARLEAAARFWLVLDFALLPIRVVAWPLVMLVDTAVRLYWDWTYAPERGQDWAPPYPLGRYTVQAGRELAKIFTGALIFAGLNAGL